MKERLAELLKAEKCTPSIFADEIGVQRSNVSHILSGRNNPGYDFLQKILIRFSNVNANWLINGVGSMYVDKSSKDLFSPQEESSTVNKENIAGITSITPNSPPELPHEIPEKKQNMEKDYHKIDKIIVFFSDGSFKEYQPATSDQ